VPLTFRTVTLLRCCPFTHWFDLPVTFLPVLHVCLMPPCRLLLHLVRLQLDVTLVIQFILLHLHFRSLHLFSCTFPRVLHLQLIYHIALIWLDPLPYTQVTCPRVPCTLDASRYVYCYRIYALPVLVGFTLATLLFVAPYVPGLLPRLRLLRLRFLRSRIPLVIYYVYGYCRLVRFPFMPVTWLVATLPLLRLRGSRHYACRFTFPFWITHHTRSTRSRITTTVPLPVHQLDSRTLHYVAPHGYPTRTTHILVQFPFTVLTPIHHIYLPSHTGLILRLVTPHARFLPGSTGSWDCRLRILTTVVPHLYHGLHVGCPTLPPTYYAHTRTFVWFTVPRWLVVTCVHTIATVLAVTVPRTPLVGLDTTRYRLRVHCTAFGSHGLYTHLCHSLPTVLVGALRIPALRTTPFPIPRVPWFTHLLHSCSYHTRILPTATCHLFR